MKLAFSTLGCPDFSWTDIYAMAKDFGFSGIEMRGLADETFSIHAKLFEADQIDKTIAQLKKKRLEICCLSSGCSLRFPEKREETIRELRTYIDLAAKLHTPFIRVLGDLTAAPNGEVDDNVVLSALKELIPYAEEKNVTLLVETNGVYADTARLRDLLNQIESDCIGALWDLHHPYRYADETPGQTVQNLGAYIKYTHAKDSVIENGKTVYEYMGSLVEKWGEGSVGKYGYSAVGAVVGATHPVQAEILRREMPHTFFLIPGYGAQGGTADDLKVCFDASGRGGIVNSSRGILCAYRKEAYAHLRFDDAARQACIDMKEDLSRAIFR